MISFRRFRPSSPRRAARVVDAEVAARFRVRVAARERAGTLRSRDPDGPVPAWWRDEQRVLYRLAAETEDRGPLGAARAVFGGRR